MKNRMEINYLVGIRVWGMQKKMHSALSCHGFGWLVGNKGWECKETPKLLYHKEAF